MAVNHKATLVDNVTNLMSCDSFNDVRVRLNNGVQVEANKVILAAMSTFFRKELHENLTNTYDGKFLEVDVDISSTKEMLDLVIKYFYTGEMNFDSLCLKDLLDLLNLLLFLNIEQLTSVVKEFIINKMKKGGFLLEKLLILSSTAEAYCFKEIVSSMVTFLGLKICDISKLPEVKYMSCEFLESLVSDAKVNVNNATFFARFETIRAWIESNDVIDDVKMKFISKFDLENFTVQQLTSSVRESKLFSDSSILDVLSKTVLELKAENEDLSELSNSQENTITELREENNNLKEEIDSKEDQINEANERAKKAREELNIAIRRASTLQTEKANLVTEKATLEKRINTAKRNYPYYSI